MEQVKLYYINVVLLLFVHLFSNIEVLYFKKNLVNIS